MEELSCGIRSSGTKKLDVQVKQIHKHLVAITRDIQELINTCYTHLMRQSNVLRLNLY